MTFFSFGTNSFKPAGIRVCSVHGVGSTFEFEISKRDFSISIEDLPAEELDPFELVQSLLLKGFTYFLVYQSSLHGTSKSDATESLDRKAKGFSN